MPSQPASPDTNAEPTRTLNAPSKLLRLGVIALLALLGSLAIRAGFSNASDTRTQTQTISPSFMLAETPGLFPDAILERLAQINSHDREAFESRRLEAPIWLSFAIEQSSVSRSLILELPILRLAKSGDAKIWIQQATFENNAPRFVLQDTSKLITRTVSRGGYSIEIDPSRDRIIVVELISFMPGEPYGLLWNKRDFDEAVASYNIIGGLLFGCVLSIAIFGVLVAAINREIQFLLFAGLLLTSLRIAAVNGGWDRNWLQLDLNDDIYLALLRFSMAAYGFFNIAIYRSLLDRDVKASIWDGLIEKLQHIFLFFSLAALFLEHSIFLKMFWALAAFSIAILSGKIAVSFFHSRNWPTAWFCISWLIMLAGMVSEIAIRSGALPESPYLNSQLGAVCSAVILGLALTNRLSVEKDDRIRAQAISLENLRNFERNFNSSPIGLFSADSLGNVKIFNPAFFELTEKRGLNPQETPAIDNLFGRNAFSTMMASVENGSDSLELKSPSGQSEPTWYLVRLARVGADTLEGSIQDITQRKLAEAQLKNLVDHDHLTGLLNRRGLENAIGRATDEVSAGVSCVIAHVDIDRFKLFNQLHGFGTGDQLLQQVAQRITGVARSRDSIARVGDSFVLVLHDCTEVAAVNAMERIREAISSQRIEFDGKSLNVTASIGVVSLDASMGYVDGMAAAGRACSEAKARGRNCVVRLNEQDSALRSHLEELRVVADMQQQIPIDRFFLEFQPIVALRSPRQSLSYEVLIRMRAEDGSVLAPGRFIGAAERHGLMSQIDRWVLRNTLEWLDNHPEHRERLAFATINLSGASLNDKRFVDDAFAMIAEHPRSVAKLCFEITETVALHDMGSTRRFADRVRLHGSKLALDDFGAGYTSFNYLKEIPADFIKIDGSFVREINLNPANFAITRTIVDLTHELGMRSIAEWAETPDTIASLIDLDVDYAQGFGLVRPCAPELLTAASSCGALITDPRVVDLLDQAPRLPLAVPQGRTSRGGAR